MGLTIGRVLLTRAGCVRVPAARHVHRLALLGIVIFRLHAVTCSESRTTADQHITATLALYLDIFNVFQNLLALLGIGNSD
jgi:FtsH-binding integral membrane protein